MWYITGCPTQDQGFWSEVFGKSRTRSECVTKHTQLQSFVKILSKHLAANKKVSFVFQQKSSTMPMMNPSPSEIVDVFSFVEVTLIQYATVAGHFPGVTASSVKPKPKKAKKSRGNCGRRLKLMPQHPSQRLKDKDEAHLRQAQPKLNLNRLKPRKVAKVEARESLESQSQNQKRGKQQCIPFFRG